MLWGKTDDDAAAGAAPCPVLKYEDVTASGRARSSLQRFEPVAVTSEDLATLVYTSGTTGDGWARVNPSLRWDVGDVVLA